MPVWELALIGRNLTNKYVYLAADDKVAGAKFEEGVMTDVPRTVMLRATYKFGQ